MNSQDTLHTNITLDSMQELPYKEIPEAPTEYTASNAIARMLDGLGYRFYWASEALRPEDLDYRISESSRTSFETLQHIFGLSNTILNTVSEKVNDGSLEMEISYDSLRSQTLINIYKASIILRNSSDEDLENYSIVFKRGERESSFPFWNLINGMAADALWHTGQIVSFRRASGNPLHPGVSVLRGKTRNIK
jgi:hypothetical protein